MLCMWTKSKANSSKTTVFHEYFRCWREHCHHYSTLFNAFSVESGDFAATSGWCTASLPLLAVLASYWEEDLLKIASNNEFLFFYVLSHFSTNLLISIFTIFPFFFFRFSVFVLMCRRLLQISTSFFWVPIILVIFPVFASNITWKQIPRIHGLSLFFVSTLCPPVLIFSHTLISHGFSPLLRPSSLHSVSHFRSIWFVAC